MANTEGIVGDKDLFFAFESMHPANCMHGALANLLWASDASILTITAGIFVPANGDSPEHNLLRLPVGNPVILSYDSQDPISAGSTGIVTLRVIGRDIPVGEYNTHLDEFPPTSGIWPP